MPTVDIHIVNALFNNFIHASQKLNQDPDLAKR